MSRGAVPRSASPPSPNGVRATPGRLCSARSASLPAPGWLRISVVSRCSGGPLGTRPLIVDHLAGARLGVEPDRQVVADARRAEVRAVAVGDHDDVEPAERHVGDREPAAVVGARLAGADRDQRARHRLAGRVVERPCR